MISVVLNKKEYIKQYIKEYYANSYSKTQFILLCFLLASFFYELPVLKISYYDRLNPRPFDIMLFINFAYNLFFTKNNLSVLKINIIYNIWFKITIFFSICAIFWWFELPKEIGSYSLYYSFKYIEGLIAIYLFVAKPLSNKQLKVLINLSIFGGIWIALATYLQVLGVLKIVRYLPNGQMVPNMVGAYYSTLGTAYQHTGMMSVITFCLVISKYKQSKNIVQSIIYIAISLFVLSPALIAGSRAALIGIFAVVGLSIVTGRKKINILLLVIVTIIVLYFFLPFTNKSDSIFMSVKRWEEFTSGSSLLGSNQTNSVVGRLLLGPDSIISVFNATGLIMLIFGAGFYVAPNIVDGVFSYRIGYGNHNIFLFPLEQGGIIAFFLSIILFIKLFGILRKGFICHEHTEDEKIIISAIFLYYIIFLIVGFAGQIFWFISGLENFVVYEMIMFSLAVSRVIQFEHSKQIQ